MISTCRMHQEWHCIEVRKNFGEPCGTRTHDPLIKSQKVLGPFDPADLRYAT